eukprot:gene6814-9330_t
MSTKGKRGWETAGVSKAQANANSNNNFSGNGNRAASNSVPDNLLNPTKILSSLSLEDRNNHRIAYLQLLQSMIGTEVDVDHVDGRKFHGVFYTATPFRDMEHQYVTKSSVEIKGGETGIEPLSTLAFGANAVVTVRTAKLDLNAKASTSEFQTDSNIRNQDLTHLNNRQLQQVATDWLDPGTNTSLGLNNNEKWDQFEANRKLFNVKSTWDENIYTKKLDRNKFTADQVAHAEKMAKLIEGTTSSNIHMQEERGQMFEREIDEEDLYSGVLRNDPTARVSPPPPPVENCWARGLKIAPTAEINSPVLSSSGSLKTNQKGPKSANKATAKSNRELVQNNSERKLRDDQNISIPVSPTGIMSGKPPGIDSIVKEEKASNSAVKSSELPIEQPLTLPAETALDTNQQFELNKPTEPTENIANKTNASEVESVTTLTNGNATGLPPKKPALNPNAKAWAPTLSTVPKSNPPSSPNVFPSSIPPGGVIPPAITMVSPAQSYSPSAAMYSVVETPNGMAQLPAAGYVFDGMHAQPIPFVSQNPTPPQMFDASRVMQSGGYPQPMFTEYGVMYQPNIPIDYNNQMQPYGMQMNIPNQMGAMPYMQPTGDMNAYGMPQGGNMINNQYAFPMGTPIMFNNGNHMGANNMNMMGSPQMMTQSPQSFVYQTSPNMQHMNQNKMNNGPDNNYRNNNYNNSGNGGNIDHRRAGGGGRGNNNNNNNRVRRDGVANNKYNNNYNNNGIGNNSGPPSTPNHNNSGNNSDAGAPDRSGEDNNSNNNNNNQTPVSSQPDGMQ